MNKKGFTLVELLAVIVVLGVIMSIAGSMVLKQKEKVNIEEAKKMENDIASLGPEVWLSKNKINQTSPKYYLSELASYGLKTETIIDEKTKKEIIGVKNPNGNGICYGYLQRTYEKEFKGHICCPGLYETGKTEKPSEDRCKNDYNPQ